MEIYLGFGSNLGDREDNIRKASKLVEESIGAELVALSKIEETEPWGFECEQKFMNAVGCYDLDLDEEMAEKYAPIVLDALKAIERMMGREEKVEYAGNGKRIYHSRTIDIDILFFGDLRMETEKLTIPHKLIGERDFVREPLLKMGSREIKEYINNLKKTSYDTR